MNPKRKLHKLSSWRNGKYAMSCFQFVTMLKVKGYWKDN